jgi:calcineurin-like phosphoesterase family protein
MDEVMIRKWNSVVKSKDVIYIIGDFAFDRHGGRISGLVNQLNGKKVLIKGNHDHWANLNIIPKINDLFDEVVDYKEIKYNKIKFILFHYPLLDWNFKKFDSIHLHGHQHVTNYDIPNMLNVSIDLHDYKPISIDEAIRLIEKKNKTLSKE